MSSILRAATGYQDLLRLRDPQLPYRFDRIFAGKGMWARRLARQRFALLRNLEASLARALEPGERVELLSWGTEYSFVEAYFLGLWHHLLNRRALVLTDRRMLLLQIDTRRRLRDLKSEVRYEAMRRFARRTPGYLGLELRDGKKLFLTGLPRADRKRIRGFLEDRLRRSEQAARAALTGGRRNLCPHCYTSVSGFPGRCPHCARPFKSGDRAGWLSLALPGLGDLYLGHRALGALQVAGALLLWTAIGSGVWEASQKSGPGEASLAVLAIPLGVFFALGHGVDAWITRRTGKKGLYPAD